MLCIILLLFVIAFYSSGIAKPENIENKLLRVEQVKITGVVSKEVIGDDTIYVVGSRRILDNSDYTLKLSEYVNKNVELEMKYSGTLVKDDVITDGEIIECRALE